MKSDVPNRKYLRYCIIFVFGALGIIVTSCHKSMKESTNSPQTAKKQALKSPVAVVDQLRASLVNKDEALFLSCFSKDRFNYECLHQTFRKVQATSRFREGLERSYGKGAWDQFQNSAYGLSSHPKLIPVAIPTEADWWIKLDIHTNGDEAVFYNPVTEMTNIIVRGDGAWTIKTGSAFGRDIDFTKLADYLKASAEAVEEITVVIQSQKTPLNQIGIALFEKCSTKLRPSK
jgi:hypothetical protein